MSQIFRPSANPISKISLLLMAIGILTCSGLAALAVHSPYLNGENEAVEQPLQFSHQHHVQGLGLDCRFCHTSVETSAHAGLPDTKTCMTCHSQIWTQAKILKPVRESFLKNEPLEWRRVLALPDHVYFNHEIHVRRGVSCTTCHGDVARMPVVRQSRTFFMKDCLDCHDSPGAYHVQPLPMTDCNVCHR